MITIIAGTDTKTKEDAFLIRKKVFVEEQKVPLHLEIDELDHEATHFVIYDDDSPIGAARMRPLAEGSCKIERLCILPEHRGKHLGSQMMDKVESFARENGWTTLTLHAQTQAIPFYEKRGYVVDSPEFLDAHIPHRAMVKKFDTK
ncbi:MAG TPA: GNAT family N-acetyltransferase [Savagea sp.]